MNSKQRVLTALNNGQPDKVPICDWIDRPTVLNLAAYLGLDSREAGAGGSSLWGQEGFESLDLLCLLIEELGDEPSHYEIFEAIRTGDPVHAAFPSRKRRGSGIPTNNRRSRWGRNA